MTDRCACVEGRQLRQVKNTGWTDRKAVMIRAPIRRSILSFCANSVTCGALSSYFFFPYEKDQTSKKKKISHTKCSTAWNSPQSNSSKQGTSDIITQPLSSLSFFFFFFSYFPFFVLSFSFKYFNL